MPSPAFKTQETYLRDMLEAAQLIERYTKGISFDSFWHNNEKRDAVALRLSVLGESANKVNAATQAALPKIPFSALRGLRNRIVHDYGAVEFHIVWAVAQKEMKPLIRHLQAHLKRIKRAGS